MLFIYNKLIFFYCILILMATCDNASTPLNLINDLSLLEKCSVNCEYKGNYPICRGSALNKGDHISVKLDSCKVQM